MFEMKVMLTYLLLALVKQNLVCNYRQLFLLANVIYILFHVKFVTVLSINLIVITYKFFYIIIVLIVLQPVFSCHVLCWIHVVFRIVLLTELYMCSCIAPRVLLLYVILQSWMEKLTIIFFSFFGQQTEIHSINTNIRTSQYTIYKFLTNISKKWGSKHLIPNRHISFTIKGFNNINSIRRMNNQHSN